jgi:hypothetical protein
LVAISEKLTEGQFATARGQVLAVRVFFFENAKFTAHRSPTSPMGGSIMNETPTKAKTPWHLWLVGTLSLLWNAVGAMDYVMTMTKNEEYMSAFSEEQLEYFYSFPSWVVSCWAIAVWGAVLGSLLLLLRKKLALPVFAVSLAGMVATTIYNFLMTNGLEIMGTGGAIFSAVIFAIAALLVIYSQRMAKRGALKPLV